MSEPKQIRGSSPVLLVKDVTSAHAYYADRLGFRSPRMWGDPPTFCIAQREGFAVMLSQIDAGDSFRPNGSYGHRIDAYFWVRDVDALHAEFSAKGAEIVCAPEDQPHGMREFQVRDPDGHLLCFGNDATGAV